MVPAFVLVLAQIGNVNIVPATTTDDQAQVEWQLLYFPWNTAIGARGGLVPITGFRVYYLPTATGTLNVGTLDGSAYSDYTPGGTIDVGTFSYLLPGLVEDTEYGFGVMCLENSTPVGNLATVVYRTAADTTPPSALVPSFATADTTETSFRVTWISSGDDLMDGGNLDHTVVTWGTQPQLDNPANVTGQVTIAGSVPGMPMSHTVTGLEPSTDYWVAARAWDNAGNASTLSVTPSSERTHDWLAFVEGPTKKKGCQTSGAAAGGFLLALLLPLGLRR